MVILFIYFKISFNKKDFSLSKTHFTYISNLESTIVSKKVLQRIFFTKFILFWKDCWKIIKEVYSSYRVAFCI